MTMQMKACPKCRQVNPLDAGTCAHCGRQFRTHFAPPDQTQMLSVHDTAAAPAPHAPPPPYAPPAPHAPVYHATTALGGPLDNTERTVSFVWTTIALIVVAVAFVYNLHAVVDAIRIPNARDLLWNLLCLLLFSAILSGVAMKWRRLYLSAPGAQEPVDTAQRRGRFAIAASIVLPLLIVAGIFMPDQNTVLPESAPRLPVAIPASATAPPASALSAPASAPAPASDPAPTPPAATTFTPSYQPADPSGALPSTFFPGGGDGAPHALGVTPQRRRRPNRSAVPPPTIIAPGPDPTHFAPQAGFGEPAAPRNGGLGGGGGPAGGGSGLGVRRDGFGSDDSSGASRRY